MRSAAIRSASSTMAEPYPISRSSLIAFLLVALPLRSYWLPGLPIAIGDPSSPGYFTVKREAAPPVRRERGPGETRFGDQRAARHIAEYRSPDRYGRPYSRIVISSG